MMNKKILENNKLIAEFMGNKLFYDLVGDVEKNSSWVDAKFNVAKYHTSWDWLMPVIENIKEFNYNKRIILHRFSFGLNYVVMKVELNRRFFDEKRMVSNNFLKQTYDLVVEFIKWYNKKTND
jgi:hypothetical protein